MAELKGILYQPPFPRVRITEQEHQQFGEICVIEFALEKSKQKARERDAYIRATEDWIKTVQSKYGPSMQKEDRWRSYDEDGRLTGEVYVE